MLHCTALSCNPCNLYKPGRSAVYCTNVAIPWYHLSQTCIASPNSRQCVRTINAAALSKGPRTRMTVPTVGWVRIVAVPRSPCGSSETMSMRR
jgi:hypothetical protein